MSLAARACQSLRSTEAVGENGLSALGVVQRLRDRIALLRFETGDSKQVPTGPNDSAHTKAVEQSHSLTHQIDSFVREGFVRIDSAFPSEIAAAREILWRDSGSDPDDCSTWTKPVIRLWDYPQEPKAANTPVLYSAFDALVGKDRWVPRESLGSFPIRFPHPDDPGDTGWHVDASFAPVRPVFSKGRALRAWSELSGGGSTSNAGCSR